MLKPVSDPIPVLELFGGLHEHLIELLRSLSPAEWQRPTVCSQWSVKDIVAHLLDGDLRRLSAQRDGYRPPDAPAGFASYQDLVVYLHELNATWTRAAARVSPRILIDLLTLVHPQVIDVYRSLEPTGPAIYPVAWAGEVDSANWFDIAREYTERWHHQAQIRLAVDQPGETYARRFYHPVLEIFLRALPHTFREADRPAGAAVNVEITGEAGGQWALIRHSDVWRLHDGNVSNPVALAVVPAPIAWRLFTKRISRESALQQYPEIRLEGDVDLAGRVLEMVSIMA